MKMTKVSSEQIKTTPELSVAADTTLLFFCVHSVTKINFPIGIIKWYIIYNNFTTNNVLVILAFEHHKLTCMNH